MVEVWVHVVCSDQQRSLHLISASDYLRFNLVFGVPSVHLVSVTLQEAVWQGQLDMQSSKNSSHTTRYVNTRLTA